MLTMMEKVEASISNLEHCVSCRLPSDVLSGFNEILKVLTVLMYMLIHTRLLRHYMYIVFDVVLYYVRLLALLFCACRATWQDQHESSHIWKPQELRCSRYECIHMLLS